MDSYYSPLVICRRLINFISCIVFGHPSPNPEITVEFKHKDEHSQISNQRMKGLDTIKSQQQILVRDSDHQEIGTEDDVNKGKGKVQEVCRAPLKRAKKSVTIKENEEMMNKKRDQAKEDTTKPKPPRHWGPLLSVASNINEKCEAFINGRKRAMRRNYTLDHPDS